MKKVLIFGLLLSFGNAYAADISVRKGLDPRDFNGAPVAVIKGELIAGDAEKFAKLVSERFFTTVVLDSAGGSLIEAIRIGEMVSLLRLPTRVDREAICASACFFIWINGKTRSAFAHNKARVGLHRPFIPTMDNSAEGVAEQARAMNFARRYLEQKFVPQRYIELMISKSSTEIHILTRDEAKEIGVDRQDLRELYIAKCGNDSSTVIDKQFEAEDKGDSATARMLGQLAKTVIECEIDLDHAARKPIVERIRSGWIPKVSF